MEGESAWVLATDQVEVELMPIKGGILVQGNQIPLELEITATGEELSSYTNKSKIRFGLDTLSTFTTKAPPPTPKHTADIKLYDVDAAGAPILEALYRSIQKTSIPSNDTIRWIIEIDPNGNIPLSPDKTVTLAWDSAGLYDDGIYEHKWMLCNGIVSSGLSNVVIDDMKAQSGYTVSGSNNLYYTLVYIQNIPTSVNENKLLASRYKLKVSPLPFKEKAEIEFTLPEHAQLEAEIFDQLGKSIFKFNKSQVLQGSTKLVWFGENRNGKEVASGTYYFKIKIISSDGYKVISGKLIKI